MSHRLLSLLRAPSRVPVLENVYRACIAGKPYTGLRAKLLAQPPDYPAGELVTVERDGVKWSLDRSDLIEWAIWWGFADPSKAELFRLVKPGMTVVDVGANVGGMALPLAKLVGPEGRVIAFEPDLRNQRRLRANLRLNPALKVSMRWVAVSNHSGIGKISGGHPHNHGLCCLHLDGGTPVEILPLDVALSDIPHVDLIKIDVEGHEEQVLEGAKGIIQRDRPILYVENHDLQLRRYGSSSKALKQTIAALGYPLIVGEDDLVCAA